jgi:hypothetical protein
LLEQVQPLRHAMQLSPPVPSPHWLVVWLVVRHVVPLQQPVLQLVALQPPPSCGSWQLLLEQISPLRQELQLSPPVPSPHMLVVWPVVTHVAPLQQPLVQLLALQPPASGGGWHTPSALHVEPPVHVRHIAPLAPHAAFAPEPTPGVWHVPVKSQQPLQPGHAPPSPPPVQSPLLHAWPEPQTWHVPPLFPHAALAVPSWHSPFESQQPLQLAGRH